MSRYEQPDYSVVEARSSFEVRRYESYLAAQTTVHGEFDSAGNKAFQRLAGFIFGRNSEGQKMNMTVPVTREETAPNTYRYRFVMEKAYSAESLPTPVDQSIELVRVPAGYYAAMRYRGRRNESHYRRAETELLQALHREGIETAGTTVNAVYDGPMTPALLRRNEVLIPIVSVEMGGILSHGSIILRELGLPAVTNAAGLRSRVRTGDLIRLDGATGSVEVLD